MSIPSIITDTSATIFIDFVPYAIPRTHANWDAIIEALNDNETTEDDMRPLLDVAHGIANYMEGSIEYRDRAIFIDGQPVDNNLTRRIIQHMTAGLDNIAAPLIKFLENVQENPSFRAVQGLYEWVERSGLPITPDGHVLAYKIVEHDFKDCYSKTFDNSPGKRVEVSRNKVDENPEQTCSYGLHVCSAKYLPNFGPSDKQVVIVKIHPKDFVAVPHDYNIAKARVCGYDVLQAVPPETAATFFPNAYVYDWASTLSFEVGEIWKTRGGDLVRILTVDKPGEYENIRAVVLAGPFKGYDHDYFDDGLYLEDEENSEDLIAICTPYDADNVAVGQSYLTRSGEIVEIGIIGGDGGIAWMTDGEKVVWASNGQNNLTDEDPNDLIVLIP